MWEIYAYQNSDSLFGILNAIAAIAGANSFQGALAIVGFCGFVAALFAYAFAPEKLQGWQWLASVTLVLSVLFVPRVTVGVVDKTGSSAVAVIDNVPYGLAVFGSLSSTVGNTLTELYETAMQVLPGSASLPSELAYQKNGLMFGSRMIRESSQMVFQDPAFRTDMINFIANCTMYDLASGDIAPDAFASADDVWPMMANPNPARFTSVTSSSGEVSIAPCNVAYANLNSRLPNQVGRIQDLLAKRMNPTLPGAAASAVIAGQIQQAYIRNGIATAAATAVDIIRQNALINAINDSSLIIGQKINDPASMLLAVGRAQATAQTNAAWINKGKIAEQALPVIRNTVEAIIYAIFPIVVLLLLMTNGRETVIGLKNYLSVLIWIQLWPPLYAILNYMALMFAARDIASAGAVGSGGSAMSLTTASSIYSSAISGEAVVGYMTLSIPYIAWAGLKRMETLGTALIGSLQMLQSTTAAATASAATGNVSMGNTSMDQVSISPVRSSPFFSSRQDDASGNTYTRNVLTGMTALKALANEGPVSHVVDAKVSQQHVASAARSIEAAHMESVIASREKAAALSEVVMRSNARSTSRSNTSGESQSRVDSIGERINSLQQIAKSVAAATGASEQQVASVAFGGSSHFGLGVPSGLKRFSPVDVGGQLFAKGEKNYSSAIQKQDQLINSALSSEDKATFKAFADSASRNTTAATAYVSDHRQSQALESKLAQTVARSERADASLRKQVGYAETVSDAYHRGESLSKDLAKDPRNIELFENLLKHEGRGSAAELVKLESYLGNMATSPNPLRRGSSLPQSFEGVTAEYKTNSGAVTVDVDSKFQEFKRAQGETTKQQQGVGADSSPASKHGAVNHSEVREEIERTGHILESKVGDSAEAFDAKGIHSKPEVPLSTERSLFESANRQVTSDPDVVAKRLKSLIKAAKDKLGSDD
jgi:conjugal transfer mating pair stabilization protein TraG